MSLSSSFWLKLIIIPIATATIAGVLVEIIKPGLIKQTVVDIVTEKKEGTLKVFTYQSANMRIVIDGRDYHIVGPNYDNPTPIVLSSGNHNVKSIIGNDSSQITVLVIGDKSLTIELKVNITPPPRLGKLKLCGDRELDVSIVIDDSVFGNRSTFANTSSPIYANDLHAHDFFLKEGGHHVHITCNDQTIDTNIVVTEDEFCLLYLYEAYFHKEAVTENIAVIPTDQVHEVVETISPPIVWLTPCESNRTGSFAVSNNTGMMLKLRVTSPNGYTDERHLPNGATTNFPNYPIGKYQMAAFYTQKKKELRLWDDMLEVNQCAEMGPVAIVVTGENPLEAEERDRAEKRARNAQAFQEAKPYISTGINEVLKRLPWR